MYDPCFFIYICIYKHTNKSNSNLLESAKGHNPNTHAVYNRDTYLRGRERIQIQNFQKIRKERTTCHNHPPIKGFEHNIYI
jgi:predicted transposase YbfD/YdcC